MPDGPQGGCNFAWRRAAPYSGLRRDDEYKESGIFSHRGAGGKRIQSGGAAVSVPAVFKPVHRPALIDLSLFKGERFILLPGDQVMGQAQENLFARMGLEGVESLYSTSTTTAVNLVSAGFGVTFLPEGGSRQVSHVDRLAFFTVGAPPFSVPLLFLYKKNVFVTPQARDFIEMTKAYYNGLRPPADL